MRIFKNFKMKITEDNIIQLKNYWGNRTTKDFIPNECAQSDKHSCGKTLNADINGAIGILRKGNAITDEQLMLLRDRGDVVSPKVFRLNL